MTTKKTRKMKIAALLQGTPTRSMVISMNAPTSLQDCAEAEGNIAARFTFALCVAEA